MTCGLVHAIYSLPEWQAVKLTFFASWTDLNSYLLFPGKLMKFIDNTWRMIAENERLQLSKTEGQVRS